GSVDQPVPVKNSHGPSRPPLGTRATCMYLSLPRSSVPYRYVYPPSSRIPEPYSTPFDETVGVTLSSLRFGSEKVASDVPIHRKSKPPGPNFSNLSANTRSSAPSTVPSPTQYQSAPMGGSPLTSRPS